MKIVFFGTGKFGLPALKKLLKSSHEVAAVVTAPDRKKGRGWNIQPMPVKAFLEQAAPGMDIFQPAKALEAAFIGSLKGIGADIFVVVDYGRLLGKEILEVPRKYCVNLHPSLLPRYRGASPVNWAILNGEEETGNTVIRMTERMDAGSIIMQETTKIGGDENVVDLLERLSRRGADLLSKALDAIEAGQERFREQDENAVSYAPKLEKKQGRIDWAASAPEIIRKVRGMQPWPGAFTYLDGRMIKILKAGPAGAGADAGTPGTVCGEGKFIVNTGSGAVRINILQLEGKKAMTSDEFLRGYRLRKGAMLK